MKTHKDIILVIDDDAFNRTLLGTSLEEHDYIVEMAEDGREGLEKLKAQDIDLVLLDLLMPEMDGFEVLRQMKTESALRHIPVIVTSAETDQESIARCIEMGAIDYLTKPFDPVLLHARVKNVLLATSRSEERSKGFSGIMLAADDDPLCRILLKTSMEEKGYVVAEAENGKQALEMLSCQSYDLVFLDLLMPEMSGFDVLERMKSDSGLQYIPVIIISSENDSESIVRCIEMGATDYLIKPFDPVILHARVNASLTTKRLYDQERAYFKAIQDERQKSERLLLNILPKPISDRLKQGEEIIADNFAEVTVMFADIVGFTQLSEKISPAELVILLNHIFSMFDRVAENKGLEKIKTIGDAYMVVGGLPIERPDHAQAIAEMALEIQREISCFNEEREKPLRIRIGIHTGPVIAGVIGTHKLSYDLWGDTVNIASRMESHGVANGIQVSSATYERLKDKYLFEKRGVIQVKGKGEMETYLLTERKTD